MYVCVYLMWCGVCVCNWKRGLCFILFGLFGDGIGWGSRSLSYNLPMFSPKQHHIAY